MVVIVAQRRRVGCTTAGVPCIGQLLAALSCASAVALGSHTYSTRGLAAIRQKAIRRRPKLCAQGWVISQSSPYIAFSAQSIAHRITSHHIASHRSTQMKASSQSLHPAPH